MEGILSNPRFSCVRDPTALLFIPNSKILREPFRNESEIIIVIVDGGFLRLGQLPAQLKSPHFVNRQMDFGWLCKFADKLQLRTASEAPRQPQEWLLKVEITLHTHVIVLNAPLPVIVNLRCFQHPLRRVNFIAYQHDRDVWTSTFQIIKPLRHILIGNPRSHIKHDNATLPLHIVAIAQTTKLLLSSSVPDIEYDFTTIRCEAQPVHLNA
mmetsp:Transcript_128733/g.209774  ORF Transcript_128733/g.209774 Transcript_128733/m.209774 type:complete len:211 (+) Transcript_128733:19-651(+)